MHLISAQHKISKVQPQQHKKLLLNPKCLVMITLFYVFTTTTTTTNNNNNNNVQCHAIADTSNGEIRAQELHAKTKASENVRWLVVARQQPQEFAKTQLDQPPTNQSNLTTTSKPEHQVISALKSSPVEIVKSNQSDEISTTTTSMPSASMANVQSWIESILINVEVMNLLQERRREKALAGLAVGTNKEYETQQQQDSSNDNETTFLPLDSLTSSSFSQAPTDSGEDLLESSLDTTTEQTNSASAQQQQQQQQQQQDSELQLVESNNVSAVLSSSSSHLLPSSSSSPPVITIANTTSKQPISCEKAYTACALREVCAPTLKAYNDDCQDLIQNRTNGQCPAKCLKAMISLRSSETGEDLVNCDCQGDEYCLQSKAQSQVCRPQVEQAIEPKTIVSCSVASWICMADQLCSTALGYYYRNCQTLFSQRHCSEYCNNSLTVLYRQPKAEKLINCQCDGSEEFPCVRYKTYTEQLCLNNNKHPIGRQHTETPTQFNIDGSDEDDFVQTNTAAGSQTTNEESASLLLSSSSSSSSSSSLTPPTPQANEDDNLTNDPSDLPPLVHSSSASSAWFSNIGGGGGGGTSDDYDDPPEDGDSPVRSGTLGRGDLSNSNSNFFNGIQAQPAIDDNWIPIVSHRYFTNLQLQQQQQQQQQQKVKQQRPPKTNLRRTQQKNSTNGSGGNKQTRTKFSESKRRHSRPHMFALTSSAAMSAPSATSINSLTGLMLALLPTLVLYAMIL